MDISVLREFTWLAKDLSFTKAAARCHVSQSVLSRHIQALEQEVGCQLLTRESNQVLLTAAGASFAARMKELVSAYDDAVAKAQDIRDEYEGTLRVAYNSSLVSPFLDRAYAQQLEQHPHIKVSLMASWEDRIATMLAQDRADIGIMMLFDEPDFRFYESLILYEDGYVALVPAGHRLAGSPMASLGDLHDETLLVASFHDSAAQSEYLMGVLGGLPGATVRAMLADKHDNVALTNAGRGIAIVRARQAAGLSLNGAVPVPIDREELSYQVGAVWRSDASTSAASDFAQILKKAVQAT